MKYSLMLIGVLGLAACAASSARGDVTYIVDIFDTKPNETVTYTVNGTPFAGNGTELLDIQLPQSDVGSAPTGSVDLVEYHNGPLSDRLLVTPNFQGGATIDIQFASDPSTLPQGQVTFGPFPETGKLQGPLTFTQTYASAATDTYFINVASDTPEPASLSLFGLGAAGMFWCTRRRRIGGNTVA